MHQTFIIPAYTKPAYLQVVRTSGGSTRVSPSMSQTALMAAVARQPVAFYFMVDDSFMYYSGGIYTSSSCTNSINHAMVLGECVGRNVCHFTTGIVVCLVTEMLLKTLS